MNVPLELIDAGVVVDATSSNNVCDSIDDLQRQLHSLTASKSTETRAEHISVSFAFRHSTIFYIAEEPEIGVTDAEDFNHSHLEQHQEQQQATRTVNISETLQNQPAVDPALQRAVAKHIAAATGVADGSSWDIQQESRAAQGWTFTYLCNKSLQTWNRHNSKKPDRPVIGAFSGHGGLDPVNISRPAFDCRGVLNISFFKSSRVVVVKYEHTPLHKTVSDLVGRLMPTPVPPPIANSNTVNANKSGKAKRPMPTEGTVRGLKKRVEKSKPEDGTEEAVTPKGNSSLPQAVTVEPVSASIYTSSIPNVPPSEAARRREVALELLAGKNIDPVTLSPEQFQIFANQDSNLQDHSLDMLVKYGAERLRIIHPGEKDQPSPPTTTPLQKNILESGAAGISTARTPTTTESPSVEKLRTEQLHSLVTESPVGDVSESVVPNGDGIPTTNLTQNTRRPRKAQGMCSTCKQNGRKCTKEHPACSNCIEAEETCVYLAPKPRRKSDKSAVPFIPEKPTDVSTTVEQQHRIDDPQLTQVTQPVEPMQPYPETAQIVPPDPNNDEPTPYANVLSGAVEQSRGDQQSAVGDIQAPDHESALPHTKNSHLTSPTFPQAKVHRDTLQSLPALSYSSTVRSARLPQQTSGWELPVPASAAQTSQTVGQTPSRNNNKRALSALEGPQSERAELNNTVQGEHVATWHETSISVGLPSQANTKPSGISHQQRAYERPKPRTSGVDPNSPVSDIPQATPGLPSKAIQQKDKSAQGTKLTYPNAIQKPSANFRHGHISQNHTPTTQTHISAPNIPASHNGTIFNSLYKNPMRDSTLSSDLPYELYAGYNATGSDQYFHADNNLPSSGISYEPGSYSGQTTATLSSEYLQGTSTGHDLSQRLDGRTSFGSTDIDNAKQWQGSQNRTSRSNAAAPSPTTSPHQLPNKCTPLSHPQGTSWDQNQQNHTSDRPQQSCSYGSYSPQQPSTHHQQEQGWVSFNPANTNTSSTSYSSGTRNCGRNNTPTPNNTGYNQYQTPVMPGYSGFSGNANLYDLIQSDDAGHQS